MQREISASLPSISDNEEKHLTNPSQDMENTSSSSSSSGTYEDDYALMKAIERVVQDTREN